MPVNSDLLAERYRDATFQRDTQSVLISRIGGSDQEGDLSVPTNGGGLGRIRHFRRQGSPGWPQNPLPIDPASKALGLGNALPSIEAQVFQNAACNWRCWYCFVPFSLLRADPKRSVWMTASQLLEAYLDQPSPPPVLDLSGGQPELTPEWVLSVMDELETRHLDRSIYLWSDDNLSSDFFWSQLSASERKRIASFRHYGRVGCFKGFDEESFAFNSAAAAELFQRQFDLMEKYLETGIDIYAYVTLTSTRTRDLAGQVRRFIDRLQCVHKNLPLRTIPLEVQVFGPVVARLNDENRAALKTQWEAVEVWQNELIERFPIELRAKPITEIALT